MRNCPQCQTQMADLMLSVAYNRWPICVRENENSKNLGHVKCAVCPQCGEVSVYMDELSKLRAHMAGR